MRVRWAMLPVAVGATLALTAAAAFGATVMVDQDGHAAPGNCAAAAPAQTTIQGGVTVANPGDTVEVCPGNYLESVTVPKTLKIVGIGTPRVVAGPNAAAFNLQANKVTVQGFELTGSLVGVQTSNQFSGYKIRSNNIHDNTIGIYLNSNGLIPTLVQKNTIANNNAPGAASGNGIYSDQGLSTAVITSNSFINNDNGGIFLIPVTVDSNISIIHNSFSEELGSDVVFFGPGAVNNSRIVNNTMHNNAADPVNGNSSIFIGGASQHDVVSANKITNPNYNGIAIRETAQNIGLTANQITGAGNNGIDVSSTAPGAVQARANRITNSQQIGINFQRGTSGSTLRSNHAIGSGGFFNCQDLGSNTWVNNTAAPSNPPGICT